MSILTLIAVIVLAVSATAFIIQFMKGNTRSSWLFAVTAVLAIALYFLANHVTQSLDAQMAESGEPAADLDFVATAEDNGDNDSVNGEDLNFVDNENADAAPTDAPANDAAPTDAPANDAALAEAPDAAPAEAPTDALADAAPAVVNTEKSPIVNAGKDIDDAKLNEKIKFDGHKSRKKSAALDKFHWDFGDGTSADGEKATHAYSTLGSYVVTLTVTDKAGNVGQGTMKVDVNRPENKVRFISKPKIADANEIKADAEELTGTFTKTYPGAKAHLEASADIAASDGCTCTLSVSLSGPGCNVTQSKKLSDGGEGDTSAKTTCRGELGDYTWSIKRMVKGSGCTCSFTSMTIDGYEG